MNNMDKMLKMASGKLGISSDELKDLLSKGDMNAIMAKMDSSEAGKLKDALNNPNMTDMLKNSPEMAEYMKNTKKP